ncbi:MAG: tol-pal system protein YbgF [Gammaproteobacteria bacterium]|nr:tol-pal system protein YbgF [Gammaproteobacteria bacterium]NND54369.1 tol-pal system protein YbgF [Gammaproteobacteria bacterium]
MTRHPLTALLVLSGLIALTAPASAQSTRDRVSTLENKVLTLERLLENNQAVQTDLLRRIQALQTENQSLREDIDRLQFDSGQGADRQRQLYLDLDARLQALEARGGGAAVAGTDGGGADAAPALNDADSYQAAFDQLKAGRYEEAQQGFLKFLTDFPDSTMRGNAQYWLAETYYVTREFRTALASFQKVITDYPTTRKVPDAWLKVGYCNYELQNWSEARAALNTAVARYPDSTAARLANERLAQMRSEGR